VFEAQNFGRNPKRKDLIIMIITKKSVEELYMTMAIDELVKRAQDGSVSEYTKNAYTLCQSLLDGISLETFAARTSNYNPNKSGIGEKSQIQWLKENKFPTIEKLPSHGKESMSVSVSSNGKYSIFMGKKSNLTGVKSFDAIEVLPQLISLFVFKTVDMGLLSDSTHLRQQKFSFNGRDVKVYIIVDGRSAPGIISVAQKAASGCSNIIISESEKI
jgi:hypothetical protein